MHRFLSSDSPRAARPLSPSSVFFPPFPYTPSDIGHKRDDGAPFSSSQVRNEFRASPHAILPCSTRPTFYPQRQRIPCVFPRSEVRIASRGSKSRATHLEVRFDLPRSGWKARRKARHHAGCLPSWSFHERSRTCVNTDLQGFRKSSATSSSMVKGLMCISRTSSGIPSWLDYIISTAIYPFLRDFVEFQKAWVQHVKGSSGCPYCHIV
ncbi:hypothetical protein EDB85DRAFT_617592 [Lactarius pseudohatsudake]|nr:hypothetical protein EDB85DRAFT_617592 [Lactarius pseudohatsudake]